MANEVVGLPHEFIFGVPADIDESLIGIRDPPRCVGGGHQSDAVRDAVFPLGNRLVVAHVGFSQNVAGLDPILCLILI